MKQQFNYLYSMQPTCELYVENVGNVCIKGLNATLYEWYLWIETDLGDSKIKLIGPFNPDNNNYFPYGFNYNYKTIQYSEHKLCKYIDSFLNDDKKLITQAKVVDVDELIEKLNGLNIEIM